MSETTLEKMVVLSFNLRNMSAEEYNEFVQFYSSILKKGTLSTLSEFAYAF